MSARSVAPQNEPIAFARLAGITTVAKWLEHHQTVKMKIALDVMGGDHAPGAVVAGAMEAVRKLSGISKLWLVGNESAIQRELEKFKEVPQAIAIRHASQAIGMDESPATALRRKKDSSIGRSAEMVKSGEADAVFSAGNTGAMVAAATLKLRTLEGVTRPAIAMVMPSPGGGFILLDAGANTDCSPEMLREFAIMGTIYSREILGKKNPSVGVVSIGGEAAKGNETTKSTHQMLSKLPLNFYGNIESHDMFEGRVDVAVCDGFVGNVILKTSESVAHLVSGWLKEELKKNPLRFLGAVLARRAFSAVKRKGDPSAYGGAPLLGANGVCIIGHGSSNAHAVFNGIRVASEAVDHKLNDQIETDLKELLVEE